ncbi:hypothetical protein [Phytohabitans suffuscus]|uniref:Uncharacterized protein n=1 Tax=Phytohabitans suffuscus TaxID=624315 RepID=A0A6F8YY09_9ACTN|nr:hypothetical protein [Phytohabitans suffuscus]BCB90828.1 hypothetical protein Psuf_081410 [Phytohabitans suffuscus]
MVVTGARVLFATGEQSRQDRPDAVELRRGDEALAVAVRDRGGSVALADVVRTRVTVANELLAMTAFAAALAALWRFLSTVERTRPGPAIRRMRRVVGATVGYYAVYGALAAPAAAALLAVAGAAAFAGVASGTLAAAAVGFRLLAAPVLSGLAADLVAGRRPGRPCR